MASDDSYHLFKKLLRLGGVATRYLCEKSCSKKLNVVESVVWQSFWPAACKT